MNLVKDRIAESQFDELLAFEKTSKKFEELLGFFQVCRQTGRDDRAISVLPKLKFYAQILGFNLYEFVPGNWLNKYLISDQKPKVQNDLDGLGKTIIPIVKTNKVVLNRLVEPKPINTNICLFCQKEIQYPRANKFYCNTTCKSNYNNQKNKDV